MPSIVRLFAVGVLLFATVGGASAETTWPEPTQTAKPWTRWWWHGSAVDEANLTRLLEEYHQAGIGGVEITCIYGVKGMEQRNREYLSDEWVAVVRHTLEEGNRLGMGVDLPAGSGWRMGGPSVTMNDANSQAVIEKKTSKDGEPVAFRFRRTTPQVVVAVDSGGNRVDLIDKLNTEDGTLTWQPPGGEWTVYALGYRWSGDRVKRPGPGGAGLNINPYSKTAVANFLTYFGEKLQELPGIRAQFHDSFEYEGDWQPGFLDEFATRRGYRLEDHLAALAGDGSEEIIGRVKCDYRETLADLVRDDFIGTWVQWSHDHEQLARNQSHGSPANWLDLYAACDIPEIESFGRLVGGDADPLVLKFASSAANVAGKPLVSSETATWLDEHFTVTLSQVKQIVDRQILAGVNHVFYHGTAYSPDDAAWPGWLFYASTQMNPQNPIWRDSPKLHEYVTRCQSVLQASAPDSDVLLYWPLLDAWHNPRGMRMNVRVHNGGDWFYRQPLGDAAKLLSDAGYTFDFVSDRLLSTCEPAGDRIQAPGCAYRAVVVPKAQHLKLETLNKLLDFAEGGAVVAFWGEPPSSEPGMAGAEPSDEWKAAQDRLAKLIEANKVFVGEDLPKLLADHGVRNEKALKLAGLSFLRKRWNDDTVYFLWNGQDKPYDGWALFRAEHASATLMDPMTGRIGATPAISNEAGIASVRIQLAPGQTVFLRTSKAPAGDEPWPLHEPSAEPTAIAGPWKVAFVDGGPELPEPFETDAPQPWTESPEESAEVFAGTARYSAKFDSPDSSTKTWRLDLGEVMSSVRVSLNGEELATLITPPYAVELTNLKPTGNKLDIEVTGVAANRIRDLDRRGVEWRIFEDINLVNINYRRFDASNWPVRPQGLDGPVTLTPMKD